MSDGPTDDPFVSAQNEVLAALQQTKALESSYLRIRSISTSAESPELIQARRELEIAVGELTTDLQDLIDSVTAAEHDPVRFGLDVKEVRQRRELVQRVGNDIEAMRQEIQRTSKSGERDPSIFGNALPSPSHFDSYSRSFADGEQDRLNDDDVDGGYDQQVQMEMMQDQDQQLDDVFKTVGNLRAQADTMGRELEEQTGIIDDANQIADRVGGKLQSGIKKVGWVLKNNEETWSSCCIGVLIFVLILLLILVLVI